MFYKNIRLQRIRRRRENKNKNKINIWLIAITLTLAIFLNAQNVLASEIISDLSALPTEQAGKLIKLTNQSRAEQGIEKLTINQNLILAAENKTRDMFEHNYFAHTSPQKITPWYWIRQAGYSYQYAGENLAMDFITSEAVHRALIASATHRKNILNPNYKEIGIAVLSGNFKERQTTIIVQMFGTAVQTVEKQKLDTDSNPPVVKKPTVVSASTNINKFSATAEKINRPVAPNNNLAGLNKKELAPLSVLPIEPDKKELISEKKENNFIPPFSRNKQLSFSQDFKSPHFYKRACLSGRQGKQEIRGILEINSNGRIKNVFRNNERDFIARHNKGSSILETVFYSNLMLNSFEEVFFEIPEYLSGFLFVRKIDAYMK
jgi:uncharacterized protein YkwD